MMYDTLADLLGQYSYPRTVFKEHMRAMLSVYGRYDGRKPAKPTDQYVRECRAELIGISDGYGLTEWVEYQRWLLARALWPKPSSKRSRRNSRGRRLVWSGLPATTLATIRELNPNLYREWYSLVTDSFGTYHTVMTADLSLYAYYRFENMTAVELALLGGG